jgi:hypothetical protein
VRPRARDLRLAPIPPVDQQFGPVTGGRDIGQAMLDRLEAADRDAEGLPVLDVVHSDVERLRSQSGQRGAGEQPPQRHDPAMQPLRLCPGSEHDSLLAIGSQVPVRDRRVGQVAWRSSVRLTTRSGHDDQLAAVERDDQVSDGARGC